MRCKVADLVVEIPEADGLAIRCQDYKHDEGCGADIIIRTELYRKEKYGSNVSGELIAYMESGSQFASQLLKYDGFYLHASAVVKDGRAYLFSGPCGTGKSTHTRLWQKVFGEEARVINDDKPALRRIDGKWYAYGTPWCGKDGININEKVPLGGICFLKQAPENKICRLNFLEAMRRILSQTIYRFRDVNKLDYLMKNLDMLLREIPIYELENVPEVSAVQLSYETMSRGAKEAGL